MYQETQWNNGMVSRVVLMTAWLLLAGCSSGPGPVKPESSPQGGPAPEHRGRPAEPAQTSTPSASAGLLQRASTARRDGDYASAEPLLQRAQRIDPRNAEIYLEYARLQAAMGEAGEARTMAERGLLYCSGATCKSLRSFLH